MAEAVSAHLAWKPEGGKIRQHQSIFLSFQDHGFVFVKKNGDAPRGDIAHAVKTVVGGYLNSKITPHVFRALQVTESARLGISQEENKAMCMGRNHSQSTSARYYERVSIQRSDSLLFLH
jgi:fructose-1,6-bisphosphatase/sedoheptulose 1,7-bisphosphatase-like protein